MSIQEDEHDRLVKTFAYEYVNFNHDPNHAYLVTNVTDENMLEIEGMAGEFAPHLFRLCGAAELEHIRKENAGKWAETRSPPWRTGAIRFQSMSDEEALSLFRHFQSKAEGR